MLTTIHATDVSRAGTLMAAVAMGISTMRRRPIRTALTTATVILLTFSILSFASFDAQQGVRQRYVGQAGNTRAIFVHHPLWNALPEHQPDLALLADPDATVTVRRWLSARSAAEAETFGVLAAATNGAACVALKAVVGIEAADLAQQPELRACLPPLYALTPLGPADAILPPAAAAALGLKPGDRLRLGGREYRFAGAFDAEALTRFAQIDRSSILPLDFSDKTLAELETSPRRGGAEGLAARQSESAYLPSLSAAQTAFVPAASLSDNPRARLVAYHVYPASHTDMRALSERLARVSWTPVYATWPDGVYRLSFAAILATAGLGNLVIPILLGGLIVLGTMLGSVADRTREIRAFSALGLAPTHIAMLFFAEASVYAVIGGLGGYILAQITAFGADWVARATGLNAPEMNYSSTNAIFAIVIVMATVLVSTIYPALRAAHGANPGVARFWKLPPPRGDVWSFAFPFTVSAHDSRGVLAFLHEYFHAFSDCSLGLFLSEEVALRREGEALALKGRIALTPFDLGVTETFNITTLPSEIEGVDEIHITLRRTSGAFNDWHRANRPFIANLRRQFLLWRALPPATMERYRAATQTLLAV
jgi:hypothetical protein